MNKDIHLIRDVLIGQEFRSQLSGAWRCSDFSLQVLNSTSNQESEYIRYTQANTLKNWITEHISQ